jgi:GGDEF domain-containing protein
MKKNKNHLLLVALFASQFLAVSSYSAIPAQMQKMKPMTTSEAQSEIEKLTGVPQKKYLKNPADRALQMARESRDQKNYVLAIKRYNYIIKNFAKTQQAAIALMDKSAMYQKMGFAEPATYNLKKSKIVSAVALQQTKEKKIK